MKIYIGSDHNGYELKERLIEWLGKYHKVIDVGNDKYEPSDDFPDYAKKVSKEVRLDIEALGILICGSGVGMCMAANRFKGIRAVGSHDEELIKAARRDDNANILCLGANYINLETAQRLVDVWLGTNFDAEERFERRLEKIDAEVDKNDGF